MSKHLLPRLFFAGSAAVLLVAAAAMAGDARAQDAVVEAGKVAAAPADGQDEMVKLLLARCPGRTQPVCGTATSGGVTLNYYFP